MKRPSPVAKQTVRLGLASTIRWLRARLQRAGIAVRSIRYTLMLWYIGVLALLLSLFGGVFYHKIAYHLNLEIDRTLTLQATRIADTLTAFWGAERAMPGSGPGNWVGSPAQTFEEMINAGQHAAFVKRWNQKTGWLSADHLIRFLDSTGHFVSQSAGFASLDVTVSPEMLAQLGQGVDVYSTSRGEDGDYRILTHPVRQHTRLLYLVQTAWPLRDVSASLTHLRMWLLWGIPLIVVMTGLIGYVLANWALRPINQMIVQAQRIGAEHLARIDVPETGDELERLATTFNDMLGRIELGFKRLRQFSAAASHELRTPLTAMRGELEVALRKPREPEAYREVLQTTLETIKEMAVTVHELLTLARSESTLTAIEWQPLDLYDVIERVSAQWRQRAETKRVHLEWRAPSRFRIYGERRLLERLLDNLLDNAIRFTPADGLITIAVDEQKSFARVIVSDTGPGIPPEILPNIFDRFFSAPRPTTDGQPSTGIGLGLCRWIAEVHQGRIEVSSQPNEGTRCTVWLPLASSRA